MIKNDRQRQITQEEIRKFEEAIANLPDFATLDNEDDRHFWQIQNDALHSMLGDLRAQLTDYEQLRTGRLQAVSLDSLPQLAEALIAARIASGLTQRQLAERLGLKEQQIQRYEATDYQSASLARITEVASALRIEVRGEIGLPGAATRAA
ncbi:MAG: helix-turn-helix domain-containing protein [Thermomicrobiales bacterium]